MDGDYQAPKTDKNEAEKCQKNCLNVCIWDSSFVWKTERNVSYYFNFLPDSCGQLSLSLYGKEHLIYFAINNTFSWNKEDH